MSNIAKPRPDRPKPHEEKPRNEEKLDEAIADSMIASDPPAIVSKGKPTAPAREEPPKHRVQKWFSGFRKK